MDAVENIRKDLLFPGTGGAPLFQKNTKAIFHFRTYKPKLEGESLVAPDPSEVIDDSRTMGNGPFELLMGREFKLDVWCEAVKTMQLNEVARFTCPFKRVMEYPMVSKALREMALKNAGKEVPHQHHCSFATLQQGTGYPDLDKLLEERGPLFFEIELIRVEQPGEYKQDNWAMSSAEKVAAISVLKEEGNVLYKKGEHLEASQKYFEALSYLEEQLVKEKPQSETWYGIASQKVPFLLNYAQCKLLMEEYVEVIRHTSSVLEIDGENIKALYRRGKAHSASWDVEEAKRDLRRAAELDASLTGAVEKELKALAQRVKEKDTVERERLKGKMFA